MLREVNRPRALDLFCNAGGASMGLYRAGFDVVGVDIEPQPDYPFTFVRGDVFDVVEEFVQEIRRRFSFVHASPPCQAYCATTKGTNKNRPNSHPELYEPTVALLEMIGLPHSIENPAASGLTLCGESFGLGVIRHRNFTLGGWTTDQPPHPRHRGRVRGWRHGVFYDGPYIAAYGKGGGKGDAREIQQAMGIDWVNDRAHLVEMIPPAYTEWIGRQALSVFG